jgi:hypothetical protein
MFRFLEAASPGCQNPMKVDLKKVAYLARQRDKKIKAGEVFVGEGKEAKLLNLTAVAFHESRCGSTLVANSMIAMDPIKHRAYSESPPPVIAYTICGDDFDRCTQEQAAAVLRDVIYLMSRTDDQREERVFFKFQSITSKKISTFQMAFPHVPWMYVYRDPVQVMMSHVKEDPTIVSNRDLMHSSSSSLCSEYCRFIPARLYTGGITSGCVVHYAKISVVYSYAFIYISYFLTYDPLFIFLSSPEKSHLY